MRNKYKGKNYKMQKLEFGRIKDKMFDSMKNFEGLMDDFSVSLIEVIKAKYYSCLDLLRDELKTDFEPRNSDFDRAIDACDLYNKFDDIAFEFKELFNRMERLSSDFECVKINEKEIENLVADAPFDSDVISNVIKKIDR